ncbi:MAG: hypothetical protein GXP62_14425, partial [Oligoflexia bacterium]|nr:hypothetical protein [Oligoflexia bacterium]
SAAEADGKWVGEQAGDLAGYHATTAGDVDGDGLADVVIGAAEADLLAVDSGAIYVLFGPATGHGSLADAPVRLSGEDADDRAGQSVASAGDADGDGLDDIFVGANGRNDQTGRIYFLAASQL